jgi:hypothetical protein
MRGFQDKDFEDSGFLYREFFLWRAPYKRATSSNLLPQTQSVSSGPPEGNEKWK